MLTDRHRERLLGYAFVAPVAIFLLALVAYPFLSAIYLSLTEKMVGYPARFVGFRNYAALADNARFRIVVRNSAIFTSASILVKLVVGMAMALALHKVVRGNQFIRGILLLPWVIPTVVIALTWKWLLDLFRGLVNVALIDAGAVTSGVHWLGDPSLAMASVVMANVWRGFPFFGISLLAGMQAIPRDLYEAAAVDGASPAQRFWRITLPGLRLVAMVTTLISTIFTLNDFNIVYVMTRGGPGTATHVLATYTYEVGFQALRWGKAVAVSMYLMPLIAVMIVLVTRSLTREE